MQKPTKFLYKVLLCAAIISATTASAKSTLDKATIEKLKGNPSFITMPKTSNSAFSTQSKFLATPKAVTNEPTSIGTVSSWGILNGPDGNEWLYTQEFTSRGSYDYASSTITIYNYENEQVGEVTVTIPEDEYVNDIQVFGYVTNNFFDSNSSTYEITVYINNVINNTIHGRIEVYTLSDGSKIASYDGTAGLFYTNTVNYTTYKRYLIVHETTDDDGEEITNIDVIAPASYQNDYTPSVEHTFTIPTENLIYSDGQYANMYFIDDQPYFVISQYEQPYMEYGDNYDMSATPDNNYVIAVYDSDFEEVATLRVPVTQNSDALFTFYTFGYFSNDDLNRGTYSNDDQLNFIVSRYDYTLSSDGYLYSFDVYNEDGELIITIGEDIYQWQMLSDVDGQPSQVALMRTGSNETIEMVDLPSCEQITTFPGTLNGELLSTAFDRYPVNKTYQYVFGLGSGYTDDSGNTITRVGWYNIDTSLDHYVDINLGPNAIYASHQFVTGSLNPYLFNTDDLHEYIMLASISQDDGTNEVVLCIANDEGEIIRQFGSEDGKGSYNYGYLSNANANGEVNLLIVHRDDDWQYTIDNYPLPFTKFEGGGTGTKADPYIISTAGDLDQIRNTPSAHYALGNNIDMSNFYGSFTPIEEFSGSLDGRGYNIDNLTIDASEMYSGLFSDIYNTNDTICDITFNNPIVNLDASCYNAGVLVGYVSSAGAGFNISNVHVNNAIFSADDSFSGSIGGIVGMITSYSTISGCSVNDITIDAPSGSDIGGIAGEMRTSAAISASRASGTINASSAIGGIVGTGGTGYTVTNCYADFQITGTNTIGGIVGSSARSLVSNCYATGSITANSSNYSGAFCVGGIAGKLTSNWSNPESTTSVIENCLAAIDAINTADGEDAVAVGRIVGFTIADEDYEEGETRYTEHGLTNNYALASMTINGATETSDDTTATAGADVAGEDLTTEFFSNTLGFLFGTTIDSPWKETNSGMPILYFEERATGINIVASSDNVNINETLTVTATVEGASANRIKFSSSDETVGEILSFVIDGNTATATVSCISEGTVDITASIDGLSATCTINVTSASGINDVIGQNSELKIYSANGNIYASGATNIEVYSINGVKVAKANSDIVEVGTVSTGIYIVVATDAAGNRATEKIIVK